MLATSSVILLDLLHIQLGAMLAHQLPRIDGSFSPKNLPASLKGAPGDGGSLNESPSRCQVTLPLQDGEVPPPMGTVQPA